MSVGRFVGTNDRSRAVRCVGHSGLLGFLMMAPVGVISGAFLLEPKREDVMMIRGTGRRLAMLGLSVLSVMIVAAGAAAELKVGDHAPAFSLKGSDGKTYTLDQFKGKSAVVIAWFPKAFTGDAPRNANRSVRTASRSTTSRSPISRPASTLPKENEKFAKSLDLRLPDSERSRQERRQGVRGA